MQEKEDLRKIYENRFTKDFSENEETAPEMMGGRSALWKILCERFFQKFVQREDAVCDVAAGYCEFINSIECAKKFAVDMNPDVSRFAGKDVRVICKSAFEIERDFRAEKIDVFFVSNFLEHLDGKDEVVHLVKMLSSLLRPGGRILILQPNIRLVGGAYWDFIDHKTPLTEKSCIELACLCGLKVEKCITRFLPYTTKSALPKGALFVKAYLALMPLSSFFFGKQSFLILKKE